MSGAQAEIITGKYGGRTSLSNDSGYFAFSGVLGEMQILISRDGYRGTVKTLNVTGDVALEVQLFTFVFADTLRLGEEVRSAVLTLAPPCDPVRWDAAAPCKRFHFRAPRNGTLVISISWESTPELDATMTTPDDTYLATSVPVGKSGLSLVAPVTKGIIYEIRVNAYYGGQVFTLRAELTSTAQDKESPS